MKEKVLEFLLKNPGTKRVEVQRKFGDGVKRCLAHLKSLGLVEIDDLCINLTLNGRLRASPTFCEACECDPCDCDWGQP